MVVLRGRRRRPGTKVCGVGATIKVSDRAMLKAPIGDLSVGERGRAASVDAGEPPGRERTAAVRTPVSEGRTGRSYPHNAPHACIPYRSRGPSWLTFLGHAKDSLWSVDLFRCESAVLKSYWVLLVLGTNSPSRSWQTRSVQVDGGYG